MGALTGCITTVLMTPFTVAHGEPTGCQRGVSCLIWSVHVYVCDCSRSHVAANKCVHVSSLLSGVKLSGRVTCMCAYKGTGKVLIIHNNLYQK